MPSKPSRPLNWVTRVRNCVRVSVSSSSSRTKIVTLPTPPVSRFGTLFLAQDQHPPFLVPFPFLKLPVELRLKIYRFCLVDDDAVLCPQTKRSIGPLRPRNSSCMALLRTCRRVYDEAVSVLYGDNLIRYYTDLGDRLRHINGPAGTSEDSLRQPQRVEICCNNPYRPTIGTLMPKKADHSRTPRSIRKKSIKSIVVGSEEDEMDEVTKAISYFKFHECSLRDVTLKVDFMNPTGENNIKIAENSRLWQRLADMDVRERLKVEITAAQWARETWKPVLSLEAYEAFKAALSLLVTEVASARRWDTTFEEDTEGSEAHIKWAWTLQPGTIKR